MKSSASIDGLGQDEEIALVVVVPYPKLQGIIDGVNSRNSNGFGFFRRNYTICQETEIG
jgi:hypothetical protein